MPYEAHDKLVSEADALGNPGLVEVTDGPWAGWRQWKQGADFEAHSGPFYCRPEGERILCGFRPDAKNRNGGGSIHGGALVTFADYVAVMASFGADASLQGVTLTINCEFVGAAEPGRLLTGRGEMVRVGNSVIFVRGAIDDAGRPVLTFSATIKRLKKAALKKDLTTHSGLTAPKKEKRGSPA